FELSSGGILFLDEVVSMSSDMQKSLLRVLERGEVLPLGSEKPVKVDVRVIAAANIDVREMVSEGSFRQDLYYRLAVLTVELPTLRNRREDIPLLIDHFFAKYPNPNGVSITPAAVRKLQAYSWPGNIRQLENEIRRALAIGRGTLDEGFFEFATGGVTNDVLPTLKLDELERYAIERALALADGQKVRTAELLGIPRRTLYEKLKRYGL
ncbi:MAG: sigma 54-interacting transcriptional regulator, partial [Candidatus Brocadiia bacterium]